MDLAAMRTHFKDYIDDPNGDVWTDTKIDRLINRAQYRMVSIIEQEDEDYFLKSEDVSVTAVSDNSDFENSLPADYRKSKKFERLVSNERPVELPFRRFNNRDKLQLSNLDLGSQKNPIVSLYGSKLVVVNPQESFTLRHWYLPNLAELSASDDESAIPEEYHDAVVYQAVLMGLINEQHSDQMIMHWRSELYNRTSEMKSHINNRQLQQPDYIDDSYWAGY